MGFRSQDALELRYDCPMKTLDPEYLAPNQFSKIAEGSDDFDCICVASIFLLSRIIPNDAG